nr:MAG TPA: hypothetical protein [Caudoviricetes sp.]
MRVEFLAYFVSAISDIYTNVCIFLMAFFKC